MINSISRYFGDKEISEYSGFSLSQTSGNRRYLYGLDKNGFSIRNFLIADHSYITFLKEDDGSITLRFTTESINTSNQTNSIITKRAGLTKTISTAEDNAANYEDLLTAMRTKPFLLLAGISGTGKSRIVKQMAFESCPDIPALRSDKTAPGNYGDRGEAQLARQQRTARLRKRDWRSALCCDSVCALSCQGYALSRRAVFRVYGRDEPCAGGAILCRISKRT